MAHVLVVTRCAVPAAEQDTFRADAVAVLRALAERDGWVRGQLARAADDADVWLLVTEWTGVGAYRRALGGYDVKVALAPLLARTGSEASAFEILYDTAGPADGLRSDRAVDADSVDIGHAAGPGAGWTPETP